MKTRRSVFFDLLVYFVKYSYFLAVLNFRYSLAVLILADNFGFYRYFFEIIFFFDCQSDQVLRLSADLFCLGFCCNDLSII